MVSRNKRLVSSREEFLHSIRCRSVYENMGHFSAPPLMLNTYTGFRRSKIREARPIHLFPSPSFSSNAPCPESVSNVRAIAITVMAAITIRTFWMTMLFFPVRGSMWMQPKKISADFTPRLVFGGSGKVGDNCAGLKLGPENVARHDAGWG